MHEFSLVEAAKDGSQRAFKKLFDLNVNNLYRFMMQFSKDKDQVEDWVQTAFIKAFSSINNFEGNSKFSTWLFRIGINVMRSDVRSKSKWQTVYLEEEELPINSIQENKFEWNENMKRFLSGLDELKRSIFVLYEVEGYSHAEISKMLEISENYSRTSLHRAKQILKEKWNNNRGNYD